MYQRQVSFTEAINMAFNKYCCFTGRASRSEFWWFALLQLIINSCFQLLAFIVAGNDTLTMICGFLIMAVGLAFLLPTLGLAVRRMHDIGKGGGWIFLNLIPLVGQIIYLVWCCKNSEMQPNRFGDVPNVVAA